MLRQFSLPTVFRMIPNTMIRDFFASLGADISTLEWEKRKQRDSDPIWEFFCLLPTDLRNKAEDILRDVFKLACAEGMTAINDAVEMMHHEPVSLGEHKKANCYVRAMLTWFADTEVFEKAVTFVHVYRLNWWRKRRNLPCQTPEFSEAVRRKMEHTLENLFADKQGRGHVCTTEMLNTGNGMYYIFAYPDDYPKSAFAHDESRTLVPRIFQHTFEVVFAYDSKHGTLEICGKVSTKVKKQLEEIFIDIILNSRIERYEETVYHLDVVRDLAKFPVIDPEDRIRIMIKGFEIMTPDGVTMYSSTTERQGHLLEFIETRINSYHEYYQDAKVTFVKLCFEFLAKGDRKRGTTTFCIGAPNLNTLQNKDPERLELIKKYLIQWGIEHAKVTESLS